MKHYLVIITFNDPYPKPTEFRVDGTHFRTAVGKALAEFRKLNKGRRIKEITINAKVI